MLHERDNIIPWTRVHSLPTGVMVIVQITGQQHISNLMLVCLTLNNHISRPVIRYELIEKKNKKARLKPDQKMMMDNHTSSGKNEKLYNRFFFGAYSKWPCIGVLLIERQIRLFRPKLYNLK